MSGERNLTKKLGPWCKRIDGKGPQHQMHMKYSLCSCFKGNDILDNSQLRFIAQDNSYVDYTGTKIFARQYWLMTVAALYKTMKLNAKNGVENCFYELMPSSSCTHADNPACRVMLEQFGTRAYLDIEFKQPCDWIHHATSDMEPKEIGKKIATMFHAHLEQFLECDCQLIILKSHRQNKLSWHFVAVCSKDGKEYLFRDSLAVMAAMEAWDEAADLSMFDYHEKGSVKNAIDMSVYSTHKLFRIYGNQKEGSNSGPLIFACYYPKKHGKPRFRDMLVLQPYSAEPARGQFELVGVESTTKLKRQRIGRQASAEPKARKRAKVGFSHSHLALEQFFFGLDIWKDAKLHLQKYFKDGINFDAAQFKSIDTVYVPLCTTKCPFNKGSYNGAHRTNHSYLYIYFGSGSCFWFCQDIDCKGKKKQIDFPLDLKMKMREVYQRKKTITIQI